VWFASDLAPRRVGANGVHTLILCSIRRCCALRVTTFLSVQLCKIRPPAQLDYSDMYGALDLRCNTTHIMLWSLLDITGRNESPQLTLPLPFDRAQVAFCQYSKPSRWGYVTHKELQLAVSPLELSCAVVRRHHE
jgi:hypothetical protein